MIRKQLLISIIFLVCTCSIHFAYANEDDTNDSCHDITNATYVNTYEQDVNGNYLTEPKKRFSIHSSSPGVVIDHQTKTMWYRCIFPGEYAKDNKDNDVCDQAGSPTINIVSGFDYTTDRSWYNAFKSAQAANAFGYGNYTDWRLPNLNELAFIVDRVCAKEAATDEQYNAFPQNFFLKYDNNNNYFINSENEILQSNSQQIWTATPKIFNEGTNDYTSYTVDFKLGTEDLKVKRKDDGTNKNVFVILMRSCTQEDEC